MNTRSRAVPRLEKRPVLHDGQNTAGAARRVVVLLCGLLLAWLGGTASAQLTTPNSYVNFEAGTNGARITTAILNAGTHGAPATWMLPSPTPTRLFITNVHDFPIHCGVEAGGTHYDDTASTRTMACNVPSARQYVTYHVTNIQPRISCGFFFHFSAFPNLGNSYDFAVFEGGGEFQSFNYDDNGDGITFRNHTQEGAEVVFNCTSNTTYWVTMLWDKDDGDAGTATMMIYDPNTWELLGSNTMNHLSRQDVDDIHFGRFDNHSTSGDSGAWVYYDDIIFDVTGSVFPILPGCSTDTPVISDILDQSVLMNDVAGPISFTVRDDQTPAEELTVTALSLDPVLLPQEGIELGGTDTDRTITLTPTPGLSGIVTVTVTVSDGEFSSSDNFQLMIKPRINSAPTISDLRNVTLFEDGITEPLIFSVGDAESEASSLIVTGRSSNPVLVPQTNIVFQGDGAIRSVSVTPAPNKSGTSTITITVSDGLLSTSDPFVLTVQEVNDPPFLSAIPDMEIDQDSSTGPIRFTAGDTETAATNLILRATCSNPALLPGRNLVLGGSGTNRTLTATPAAGQTGAVTITLTLGDGKLTTTNSFVLTVNQNLGGSYLLAEGFEGTGFENTGWLKNGTPNENYTNVVLHGRQSLNCAGGQYIWRDLAMAENFSMYFQVRWRTWADYGSIIHFEAPDFSAAAAIYADDNRLELIHGNASSTGTTPITTNVTYHVWVDWAKGTEGDGTMNLYIATNTSKPAEPEATITNGDGSTIQRLYVGPSTSGPNVIFDRLLIDDEPIGSNPAFNKPPFISDIPGQRSIQGKAVGSLAFKVSDLETPATNLIVTGSSSNPELVPDTTIVFGGSGSNRTVTLTPPPSQPGSATITLNVFDGAQNTTGSFLLTVNESNRPPVISSIEDQTMDEDTPTEELPFTVGDSQTPSASLTLSASSSNPSLISSTGFIFGGSDSNRTVRVIPITNRYGTATVTLTVSDGTFSNRTSFGVTVSPVNDPPTLSQVANQTLNEDTPRAALAFTVGDVETAATNLIVSATSSNPELLPDRNLILGGTGTNRTIKFTPATNQFGTATVTLFVTDGSLTTSNSFGVTVNPVNDAPVISNIPNQSTARGLPIGPIDFTVGDVDTAESSLTVTAASSNPALVPVASILFGGSGSNRTVTITPVATGIGTATLTFTVRDGSLTASDSFVLTVTNTRPTMSPVADQIVNEDAASPTLSFTIADAETAASSLVVTAASSNTNLVPNNRIVLGGTGTNRTVRITPGTNQSGTGTITLAVSDSKLSTSRSFLLTVNPVNDAPTLSNIPNQSTPRLTARGPISFTVGDVDNATSNLTLTATSSNPALIPVTAVVFGGSGPNRTVTMTPAGTLTGSAIITVTVSDGDLTASDAFALTVTTANSAPSISATPAQTVDEDTATEVLAFTVGDFETAATNLLVTATSSNPALVPNTSLLLGGNGSNRTVRVTPLANRFGTAIITLRVSDGSLAATNKFVLTVNPVNDAPTISAFPDQTLDEDTTTAPLPFTIGDMETSLVNLLVTVSSSDPVLIPSTGFILGSNGTTHFLTLIPAPNQSGTATVTVTISDGSLSNSTAFNLTVIPRQ